jgi:hypothetical protein
VGETREISRIREDSMGSGPHDISRLYRDPARLRRIMAKATVRRKEIRTLFILVIQSEACG